MVRTVVNLALMWQQHHIKQSPELLHQNVSGLFIQEQMLIAGCMQKGFFTSASTQFSLMTASNTPSKLLKFSLVVRIVVADPSIKKHNQTLLDGHDGFYPFD